VALHFKGREWYKRIKINPTLTKEQNMSDTVVNFQDQRNKKRGFIPENMDLTVDIVAPNQQPVSIEMSGMCVVHWMDPDSGRWEIEVGSIGLYNLQDPSQIEVPAHFLDCLTPALSFKEEDKPARFFLRKQFFPGFNATLVASGHPQIPKDAVVLIKANGTAQAAFDRWQILRVEEMVETKPDN
jgi:hypothetical protein